jgi:hypothetical protein
MGFGSYLRRSACALGLVVLTAGAGHAQRSGDGFLFNGPTGTLTFHGGFAQPMASSDLFDEVTELLTLSRGDFGGLGVGADLAFFVSPRFALSFGGAYSGSSARSEFRDWVDEEDDSPIEQTTRFRRAPLLVGVKGYLKEPGRAIGRRAWIPARYAPYVGLSAGTVWYRFDQEGDFVREDLSIVRDQLMSDGWAPALQASAGVDVTLRPWLLLVGETRFLRANAELSNHFHGFEPIDLSGVSASVGLSLRF